MIELKLKRIARKKGYTIGHLYVSEERRVKSEESSSSEETSSPAKQMNWLSPSAPTCGSSLFTHHSSFLCDTLEPTWRDIGFGRPGKKIKGKTAIPEGRYPVVVTWSPRFKQWLPLLVGVPQFRGIRIHAGNTPEDTEGCILVGENKKKGMVLNSRQALRRLMKLLDARPAGEPVFITIE